MDILCRTILVWIRVKSYGLIFPFVNAGNCREVVWFLIMVAAAVRCRKQNIKFPTTQTLFTTISDDFGFKVRVGSLRYPLYRLWYKSISFHGSVCYSLPRRTVDIKNDDTITQGVPPAGYFSWVIDGRFQEQGIFLNCFTRMKLLRPFETSVTIYQSTRRWLNLKSCKNKFIMNLLYATLTHFPIY
jgi:hypothetical protein